MLIFLYTTIDLYNLQLITSMIIYLIGTLGIFLNRNNFLLSLVSIEVMLLGLNLLFILFSIHLDDIIGILFSFFILTVAAADAAIGISLIVKYYKTTDTITNYSYSIRG